MGQNNNFELTKYTDSKSADFHGSEQTKYDGNFVDAAQPQENRLYYSWFQLVLGK